MYSEVEKKMTKYGMEKQKIKYTTVSISEELMNEIKKHISEYNYVSIADFIRIAVRERMEIDTTGECLHTSVSLKTIDQRLSDLQKLMLQAIEKR